MNNEEKSQKIEELLKRGVSSIYPSKDFLENKLKGDGKLILYHGIDPTGPTLHLGHAVQLKKLSEFQSLGHKIILLIGDFTAMIGDPTGKISTRKMLTRAEVLANAKLYKKQASKWLSFSGENKAEIKYNSKWLSKMNLASFMGLASNMTVDQLLERDMFKKRREDGKPIFLHEFFYPLLQGFDSVAMEVDGELGGNDQIFNMLAGRDLLKILKNKEKFVMATKLLEDNSGKKMGKTEGNMVALNEEPKEIFGKIMSWTDGLILPGLELCTVLSTEKIEEIKKKMDEGMNPRDAKMILAEEVVAIYHGRKKAKDAKKAFMASFSEKVIAEDVQELLTEAGSFLSDVLFGANLVSSKGEFRRLIEGGGIREIETGEKINDPFYKISKEIALRVGKHRFAKIKIK